MLLPAKPVREFNARAEWRFSPKRGNVPGFDDFYESFLALAEKNDGRIVRFANGCYRATFGRERAPLAWFMSGMHGDEQAGPLALLEWLKIGGHRRLLKAGISLSILPLVNDRGWEDYVRNYGRRNLNRNFNARAPQFLREIMSDMRRRAPRYFLDLHEDQQVRDAYIFRMKDDPSGLSEYLQNGMRCYDMVWTPRKSWSGTSEVFARSLGCRLAATTETPRGWSLKKRIEWHCNCLDLASKFFIRKS
jgi:predicted deacylase